MGVELANRQRALRVDAVLLKGRIEQMLALLDRSGNELSVALVSDRRIRDLNRTYRGVDGSTDVLSFSLLDGQDGATVARPLPIGDVVISVQTAERQAKQRDDELGGVGYTTLDELTFLALHGLLHLVGYDHEAPRDAARMEALEAEIFRHVSPHPPRAHHGVDP